MARGKGTVNRVILVGNVGMEPELKETPNGVAVTTISVATTEVWKDADGKTQQRTEWHRVIAWRKDAEIAAKFLSKGSKVFIEGRLQTRSYGDEDGNKRFVTEIIADILTLLDGKPDDPTSPAPEASDEGPITTEEISG